jgi:hypothetical protein
MNTILTRSPRRYLTRAAALAASAATGGAAIAVAVLLVGAQATPRLAEVEVQSVLAERERLATAVPSSGEAIAFL